jgi:hypothetical protein
LAFTKQRTALLFLVIQLRRVSRVWLNALNVGHSISCASFLGKALSDDSWNVLGSSAVLGTACNGTVSELVAAMGVWAGGSYLRTPKAASSFSASP